MCVYISQGPPQLTFCVGYRVGLVALDMKNKNKRKS